MYAALLDACVLVPNALCDTLLRLGERGFYQPLWSQRILDELKHAVLAIRPDIGEERIQARIAAMTATFDEAMVTGWEYDTNGTFVLADPGQTRFQFMVDDNGTPDDPSDDQEIEGSFQIIRESTGRNDTQDRDFCADLVTFTS